MEPAAGHSVLQRTAMCLVITATSWFLLQQLAVLLRPLCLAIFLAYVIVPLNVGLRERVRGVTSFILLGIVAVLVLLLLFWLTYGSIIEFNQDLPQLLNRGKSYIQSGR